MADRPPRPRPRPTSRRWRNGFATTIRRGLGDALKLTIGAIPLTEELLRTGQASAAHPARRRRTRSARHVRERREPDPEPLGRAAARHRRARGARRRTAAPLPGPAQRSPHPCDVRRRARARPRVLEPARDPRRTHHQPSGHQHHPARLARRRLHERARARQRGALRARAARSADFAGTFTISYARAPRARPVDDGSTGCRGRWSSPASPLRSSCWSAQDSSSAASEISSRSHPASARPTC